MNAPSVHISYKYWNTTKTEHGIYLRWAGQVDIWTNLARSRKGEWKGRGRRNNEFVVFITSIITKNVSGNGHNYVSVVLLVGCTRFLRFNGTVLMSLLNKKQMQYFRNCRVECNYTISINVCVTWWGNELHLPHLVVSNATMFEQHLASWFWIDL